LEFEKVRPSKVEIPQRNLIRVSIDTAGKIQNSEAKIVEICGLL
jgi:hypothetical protein